MMVKIAEKNSSVKFIPNSGMEKHWGWYFQATVRLDLDQRSDPCSSDGPDIKHVNFELERNFDVTLRSQ